ncbi:MAG: Rrf2 family transcriptional regulator [Lachnospiraceae bacterium]|nr:Rrf2 family transcriptional regulator [Lachnospiraceae bacterium]
MISTRGRYALRVLIYLAEHSKDERIPLKAISASEGISQKYLESIMTTLSKAGMVDAIHGKGGGYKLNRTPDQYTVGELLRLTETTLAPVSCLGSAVNPCERADSCRTLPIWIKLNKLMNDYLDSVTIEDLMNTSPQYDDSLYWPCGL